MLSGSDQEYRVKFIQYYATWPVYTFSADSWRRQQRRMMCKTARRPSISHDLYLPRSWPECRRNPPDLRHSTQDLFMLGENELRYVSGCDNVLAAVASVVCSDGSDSIRDHLQEDHFQLSTPPVGGDLQGIPHNQELDGGNPRGIPLNQERSALEEYRRRDSVGRYPLLLRHLWVHGSVWLAEDGERRPRGASQGEMLSRVLSDLLLLDRTSRVCLLLNPDLDQCQQMLLQRASRMIENQQWSEFMKFSETVRCFGLNQSSCSELRLLHDYCMCCALTRDLENASSEKSAGWRPLLKICESELKCRMILGTLHHWDQDVCLQLLKTCLQREDTETTALQKLLVRRLNEMKVYRKVHFI